MADVNNNVNISINVNENNSTQTLGNLENKVKALNNSANEGGKSIGKLGGTIKDELSSAAENASGNLGGFGNILTKMGPWGIAAAAAITGLVAVFRQFGPVVDFVEDSISTLGATFNFVVQKTGEFIGIFEETKKTLGDYVNAAKQANEIARLLEDSQGINNVRVAESEALIKTYLVQLRNKNLSEREANQILLQAQIQTDRIIAIKKQEFALKESELRLRLQENGVTEEQINLIKERGLVDIEISENAKTFAQQYLDLLVKRYEQEGAYDALNERLENARDSRKQRLSDKENKRKEDEKKKNEEIEKSKTKILEEEAKKREELLSFIVKTQEMTASKTKESYKEISETILKNFEYLTQEEINILVKQNELIKNYNKTVNESVINSINLITKENFKSIKEINKKYPELLEEAFIKVGDAYDELYSQPVIELESKIREEQIKTLQNFQLTEKEKIEFFYLNTNERTDFINKKYQEEYEFYKNLSDNIKKTDEETTQFQIRNREKVLSTTSRIFGDISSLYEQGSNEQKAFATVSLIANQAVAVSNALATAFSPASADNQVTGGLAGVAKFATYLGIITSTIAGLKNIWSVQPTNTNEGTKQRKYANGGILQGPSHSSGGIQTPFGELEGGEIVLNKNVTENKAARTIASKLNKQMGGVDFANSGDVIKVEIANPQYLKAEVSDRKLRKTSKSF